MGRINRYFTVLVFLFCVAKPVFASVNYKVDSRVDTTQTAPGKIITLTVSLIWEGTVEDITLQPVKPPDAYLMELADIKQENSTYLFNNLKYTACTIAYTFSATEPGEGRISYAVLEFTENDTQIKRVERTPAYDIAIYSPGRYLLRQAARYAVMGIIGLALLAVVTVIILGIRKHHLKRVAVVQQELASSTDFEHQMLDELKRVRAYKLSGETDKFFDGLSKVLYSYFEKRYGISFARSLAVSEDELINKHQVPTSLLIEFKDIVATASRIKFSGESLPPDELDRWYKRAEKLIKAFITRKKQEKIQNINLVDNEGESQ